MRLLQQRDLYAKRKFLFAPCIRSVSLRKISQTLSMLTYISFHFFHFWESHFFLIFLPFLPFFFCPHNFFFASLAFSLFFYLRISPSLSLKTYFLRLHIFSHLSLIFLSSSSSVFLSPSSLRSAKTNTKMSFSSCRSGTAFVLRWQLEMALFRRFRKCVPLSLPLSLFCFFYSPTLHFPSTLPIFEAKLRNDRLLLTKMAALCTADGIVLPFFLYAWKISARFCYRLFVFNFSFFLTIQALSCCVR